jgi:hypothetical protein
VHYLKESKTLTILGINLVLKTMTHEADGSSTVFLEVAGRTGSIEFPFPTKAESLLAAIANPIIITRHEGLIEYLRDLSPDLGALQVLTHATPADVRGRVVVGVLPPHLASIALLLIEIPLDFSNPAMRGVELTCEQVASLAGEPRFYRVSGC